MSVKKILIVDDSLAEVRMMQAVLEEAGYWSVAVNDPTKIEQVIDVERPSLILLDVVMPRRNGFQACRELKKRYVFETYPTTHLYRQGKLVERKEGAVEAADLERAIEALLLKG